MSSTEIAERPKGGARLDAGLAAGNTVLAPADWQMLSAIAETVSGTEFVPAGLRGSSPKVLACMLYGHALGIQPMIALKEISVIEGSPSMSAALMVALIRGAGHSIKRVPIMDGETMTGCTAVGVRSDGTEDSYTFTIQMAMRAGLMGKNNWQKYPEAMLWARAASQLATFLFSDVFSGSPYTEDELEEADVEPTEPPTPSAVAREQIVEALEKRAGAEFEQAEEGTRLATPEEVASAATGRNLAAVPDESERAATIVEEAREHFAAQAAVSLSAIPEGSEPAGAVEAPEAPEEAPAQAFWTPLDDRDPTVVEFAFAKSVVSGSVEVPEGEPGALMLEAAQTLIEAYEAIAAHNEAVSSIVPTGTVAELMLKVNDAIKAKDVAFLESLLAHEEAQKRPRVRLVDALKAAVAEAGQAPAEEADAEVGEVEADAPEADAPEVEAEIEFGAAAEAVASMGEPPIHRHDPGIAFADLDNVQRVVRCRAILGYMLEHDPENQNWQYDTVLTAASNIWHVPVDSLDELEGHQIEKIIAASPEAARVHVAGLTGAEVEALAATVAGENPA